ncbi:MAG: amino acid kinase family protein, partial [Candidatus Syntropharchaeia archaeon]
KVTSDTISAWIAKKLNSPLIKATDVDGILINSSLVREIGAKELMNIGVTCVDEELPKFLWRERMNCMIVNGNFPERIGNAIEGKPVLGTMIKGEKDGRNGTRD